jgi:Putative 2OG-Fe(II) oxygenase
MADQISNLQGDQALFYTFPNSGVLFHRVPEDIMSKVREVTNGAVDKEFEGSVEAGYKLTANIAKEYDFTEELAPVLLDYINSLIHLHDRRSQPHFINEVVNVASHPRRFKFKDVWANFQKKHEFHPHHIHGGVYSFVIWTKIPYNIQDEIAVFPKATLKCASMFVFYYTDILGQVRSHPIPVDHPYEGIICLFPKGLGHSVNPFYTSDDYRIAVSGDIVMDTD